MSERAALLAQAQRVVAERYRLYEELATRGGESFHPARSVPSQAAEDHGHS